MHAPFPDQFFDRAFAIEALCHAPDLLKCYQEIFQSPRMVGSSPAMSMYFRSLRVHGSPAAAVQNCDPTCFLLMMAFSFFRFFRFSSSSSSSSSSSLPLCGFRWCTTPLFNPNDPAHQAIIKEVEICNCVHVRSMQEVQEVLNAAGWTIEEAVDRNLDPLMQIPFYEPLAGNVKSLSGLLASPVGRNITHFFVSVLESLCLAQKGSTLVSCFSVCL